LGCSYWVIWVICLKMITMFAPDWENLSLTSMS
jgi:hypothetical protein